MSRQLIFAAFLVGIAALAATTHAFNPQPDPPAFGMIGISEGQTARLNVVNVATPFEVSPGPCRANLQFVDADGHVLASRRVSLSAGRATSLDYAVTFAGAGAVLGPARAEIRPVVDPLIGGVSPGPCRATVEIVDNETGRTSVFYAPSAVGGVDAGRQ